MVLLHHCGVLPLSSLTAVRDDLSLPLLNVFNIFGADAVNNIPPLQNNPPQAVENNDDDIIHIQNIEEADNANNDGNVLQHFNPINLITMNSPQALAAEMLSYYLRVASATNLRTPVSAWLLKALFTLVLKMS